MPAGEARAYAHRWAVRKPPAKSTDRTAPVTGLVSMRSRLRGNAAGLLAAGMAVVLAGRAADVLADLPQTAAAVEPASG